MRLLVVLLAYGAGQIPTGVLLARRAGVDVRRTGSGNVGATNVARAAGVRLGLLTLAGDAAKGAGAVLLAKAADPHGATAPLAGLAAVLGHTYPAAFGFAGGKGVATALGVLAVLCPLAAAPPLAVFASVAAAWRYVSVASVLAALTAPVGTAALGYPPAVVWAVAAIALVVVARHRENLARLRSGTEPRFTMPNKQAPPAE